MQRTDYSSEQMAARARRFAGKPKEVIPVQKKSFAHAGGVMKTNKEQALKKYMARKELTQTQMAEMALREERFASRAPLACNTSATCNTAAQSDAKAAAAKVSLEKKIRKLKKRIKEIELLEQKDKLQKNQQEKVAKKPELQLRLQRLEGEV
jgi:hypothetical protein